MKFCIISPVKGLERFATKSDIHLILPQVRSKEYTSFYQQRRSAGDTIILDNGAYEGFFPTPGRIHKCIEAYNPQIIVCPDSLLSDWEVTVKLTFDFLDRYYDSNFEFMAVPQSLEGDIYHWWMCCRELLEDHRIEWIGLPRALYTHYGRHNDLRSTIARVIKDTRPDIKIHALGMAAGSLAELECLAKSQCVEACDSSAPVWRGWNGFDIEEYTAWEQHGFPMDFKAEWDQHQRENLIISNLNKVLNICRWNLNSSQDFLKDMVP
jgi:hypothetical protein